MLISTVHVSSGCVFVFASSLERVSYTSPSHTKSESEGARYCEKGRVECVMLTGLVGIALAHPILSGLDFGASNPSSHMGLAGLSANKRGCCSGANRTPVNQDRPRSGRQHHETRGR